MTTSVIDVATILTRKNSHKLKEQQKKYEIADGSDEDEEELYERTSPLRLIVGKTKKHRFDKFPVSFFDTVTFYRAFMVTIVKHCNISLRFGHSTNFSHVIQTLFSTMFEGCLATLYVQTFFGIYVPGAHLYISKIAPLFSGVDVLYLVCSIVELCRFSDIVLIYAGYFFTGLILKNPWDQCPSNMDTYYLIYMNKTIPIQCLLVETFKYNTKNYSKIYYITGTAYSCYYYEKTKMCFTVPQIIFNYAYYNLMKRNEIIVDICFIIIWTFAAFFCNTIYKKQIWRSLTYANITLFTIHVLLLVYLKLIFDDQLEIPKKVITQIKPEISLWECLVNMSNSYIHTPPVIHIITSRRPKKQSNPGWMSALLVLSNTLYTMIYFYVHSEINDYAGSMLGVDINPVMNSFYINPVLHYMFIFFWKFSFGNILSLFYLSLSAVHELLILIITYQLVIELIVAQFPWLPRVMAVAIVTIFGLAFNVSLPVQYLFITHAYLKGILILIELVAIYALYPIHRLIDDLTFYFGEKPSRIWRVIIITYPIVLIRRLANCNWVLEDKIYFVDVKMVYYTITAIIPIVLISGLIYMVFKLRWNKMQARQLFCPSMDWGPHSFTIRQLRKQFRYRDYVLSSAPKVLTRFLIRNSEPDKYKLDVCYDGINTKQAALTVTEAFHMKNR